MPPARFCAPERSPVLPPSGPLDKSATARGCPNARGTPPEYPAHVRPGGSCAGILCGATAAPRHQSKRPKACRCPSPLPGPDPPRCARRRDQNRADWPEHGQSSDRGAGSAAQSNPPPPHQARYALQAAHKPFAVRRPTASGPKRARPNTRPPPQRRSPDPAPIAPPAQAPMRPTRPDQHPPYTPVAAATNATCRPETHHGSDQYPRSMSLSVITRKAAA
mmetsp:Transcript_23690/g.42311  ORF Transcript_23690/g.42311 Transcript_23690/m.42311 type:complete len:220 (-) Transcript_23690:3096-3755(-)